MFNAEVEMTDCEFKQFRELIYDIAGISLSDRKRELVKSRLARRLRAHELSSYADYISLLRDPVQSKLELEHFTNALTTNKTEFFREAHHFEYLKQEFFPQLRHATLAGRDKKLRLWCAASSTGQEPYTLAMTILDYFGPANGWDLRMLASDIDTQVLATAMEGLYPDSEMDGVPSNLRGKYFKKEAGNPEPQWRVKTELKELITFRQLNLNHPDWPIQTQFDAIFCRNVMIYFDQATQTRLVERFSRYLSPGGLLVIGHSESLFSITDLFDSIGDTIYKLKPSAVTSIPKPFRTPLTSVSMPTISRPIASKPTASKPTASTPTSATATRVSNAMSAAEHLSKVPTSTPQAIEQSVRLPTKVLVVGEYEAASDECILQTALGSCVAACLYDPSHQLGGMNHFMLPEPCVENEVCASYGVHAMELLINAIMKLGGSRRHIIAKIFGGAQVVDGFGPNMNIGQRNVDFVKRFLDTERIPIAAEHVLGKNGRRVKFIPSTGKVYVSLLNRLESVSAQQDEDNQGNLLWTPESLAMPPTVTMFTPG